MSLLHLLFGFSGRINRGKYWLAVVLWLVFWAIALPAWASTSSARIWSMVSYRAAATGSRSSFT